MNTLVITRRELSTYFQSLLAYVAGAIFLFTSGFVFFFTAILPNIASLNQFFHIVSFVLLFLLPILTMHLLSSEVRSGTLELLLTTPVRVFEVVIGKFLASFLFFLIIMLAPTLAYLVILIYYGNPDLPVTFSSYLGIILLGTMLISLGVLTSAFSDNQIVAALLAVMLSLFFWLVGRLGAVVGDTYGYIFTYFSIQEHYSDFVSGLISTSNIVYFLSVTVGALFIATHILQVRR